VQQRLIGKDSIAVRRNMPQDIVTSASPMSPPIWAPPPRPAPSFSTKGVDEVKQQVERLIAKKKFAEAIKEVNEWAESNTHRARLRPAEWEAMLLVKRDVWRNGESEYAKTQGGDGLWLVRSIRMQAQVYEDLMQHCADVNDSADKTRHYYLLAVKKAQSAIDTGKHLRDAAERNNEKRLAYHQRGLAKHRYGKHTRNILLLDEAIADYQKATGLFSAAERREPDAVAVYGSLSDAERDRNELTASSQLPTGRPAKRYPPRPGLVRPDRSIR
jgi:tetratricopeptide (TPR) repeat protein